MPKVDVVFYKEDDGTIPFLVWLDEVERRDVRARAKCETRLDLLAEMGYDLHRPHADLLRDGIHELRIRFGSVNYRILYFFYERTAAVVAHGLTKEDAVPDKDIEIAIKRRDKFIVAPEEHRGVAGGEDE